MRKQYEIKPTIVSKINPNNKEFKTNNSIIKELIDIFIKTLEDNLPNEYLTTMYNNLSTLKIEHKHILIKIISGIVTDYLITGGYYLSENIINILPIDNKFLITKYIGISKEEYVINLYHELLHMSSTIIDEYNKIAYSGFYQTNKEDHEEIGFALDDAYTDMLLYRLFNVDHNFISYQYEIEIAKILEEIISQDIMTNLYFTANLYELISILEKYHNKENIIDFITDLDEINVLQEHSKKNKSNIIRCHHRIMIFITELYFNKLKEDILSNNLNKEEYLHKLDNYLNIINNQYIILNLEQDKLKSAGYKKLLKKIKELNEITLSIFNDKSIIKKTLNKS